MNVETRNCRRCGGNLHTTTVSSGREYEKCADCHFQYPVISLITV